MNLWWQRTKVQVANWDEFQLHFMKMFGSTDDHDAALEKLLCRRQRRGEPFNQFAMEMELQYIKLHRQEDYNAKKIIKFISERALPHLRPHLLGSNANDI